MVPRCRRSPPRWPTPADAAQTARLQARLAAWYAELGAGEPPAPTAPLPSFDREALLHLLAVRPTVASFHFGLPKPADVTAIKAAGIKVIASATTPQEARALEVGGVDAVIAQGWQAKPIGSIAPCRRPSWSPPWHVRRWRGLLRPSDAGRERSVDYPMGTDEHGLFRSGDVRACRSFRRRGCRSCASSGRRPATASPAPAGVSTRWCRSARPAGGTPRT